MIQDGQQGSVTRRGRYGSIKFALDNLTISKDPTRKVPAFIAIAVQDGGGDGPNNERGLEYDTISERYGLFVQNEVIPAVKADPKVKAAFPSFTLTDNPEGRGTFGCSSGAAAAFTMAWFHPELFRRVITYSGTFVALQNTQLPEAAMYPHGAWDYHHDLNLIASADRKPLRVFSLTPTRMTTAPRRRRSGPPQLAGRQRGDALGADGQGLPQSRYVYGVGVGHCDDNLLRATLADALVWTWRGYPSN